VTGSELWLIRATGEKVRLDQDLKGASGVAFSPDGLWLFVSQSLSRTGLSYRVRPDGTLDARAPFYDFDVPAWADDSGAAGIGMDHDGRAYVATWMGVQVFDRNGRVAAILPLPGNAAATSLCFGGHDFDTLYVAGGGKVYRRKLHVQGAPPWAAPAKLPPWGAG
jgi:gluconolactonase